ncbi:hypothetical protein ERO13_A08G072401v2 [Gossypium hirsutum]|nr:hypothetical protein ERO13_A08G072401v2 [Gossypium hirsutum]
MAATFAHHHVKQPHFILFSSLPLILLVPFSFSHYFLLYSILLFLLLLCQVFVRSSLSPSSGHYASTGFDSFYSPTQDSGDPTPLPIQLS